MLHKTKAHVIIGGIFPGSGFQTQPRHYLKYIVMGEAVHIFIEIMVDRKPQRYARRMVRKHTHGDVLVPLVIHPEIGEIRCDRGVKFDLSLFHKLHDRQCGIHFAHRRNAIYPVLRSGCFGCQFRLCRFGIHRISARCAYRSRQTQSGHCRNPLFLHRFLHFQSVISSVTDIFLILPALM